MRALLLLALLGLAAPLVAAQTAINPIEGPYEENYIVTGRILDKNGNPASGARLSVTIVQQGVRASDEPATANCKGDFIVAFRGLHEVSPRGQTKVTLLANPLGAEVVAHAALDPFVRRTDMRMDVPYAWTYVCAEEKNPPFDTVISVTGRVLNRTDPYKAEGVTYHARAYKGPVALAWMASDGSFVCPPATTGGCDTTYTDERGDFRYTWTFQQPVIPGGHVSVFVGGKVFNATVDPTSRLAVHHIELSGQGPPATERTPGAGALFALAAVAVAALVARRLLPARPR